VGEIEVDIGFEKQIREKCDVYIGAGHFTLDSLYFTSGTEKSSPRLELTGGTSPQPRPYILPTEVLATLHQHVTGSKAPRRRSAASLKGPLVALCPCSDTVNLCTEFLQNNDTKVHPPAGVTANW
jgi:hypothetical protein